MKEFDLIGYIKERHPEIPTEMPQYMKEANDEIWNDIFEKATNNK